MIVCMKREYIAPEIEVTYVSVEAMLKTDSIGHEDPGDAGAKENNFLFEDDNFGDTWGVDSNNLWGDED